MMLLGLLISTPATAGRLRGAEAEAVRDAVKEHTQTSGSTLFLLGVAPDHKRVRNTGMLAHVVPEAEWTAATAAVLPTVDGVSTTVAAEDLLEHLVSTGAAEVQVQDALVEVFTKLQEGREGIVVTVPEGRRRLQHWALHGNVLYRLQ